MRRIRFFGLFIALLFLCSGCAQSKPAQRQIFAMDTVMFFTAHGNHAENALTQAQDYILQLEQALSVTRPESDIAQINQNSGSWVKVGEETFSLLLAAKDLCLSTGGALDITAYPAVKAWGFTTGEYRVPDPAELAQLAEEIDYSRLELDKAGRSVRLPQGMELDLGALAKGWAGEQLAHRIKAQGIDSATLSLGGNVQTVGCKPDGSPWRVGIQDPHSQQGAYLASVAVEDMAVVTSGGYERYFEENGVHYCHIIDPETAAPAQGGLASATIVGSSGTLCDAYSTALFLMGPEEAARFWQKHQTEFDYILVLEDGSIHITQGLNDTFQLTEGYKDRKVTVIAP
jgi:thiamine biosynthesis lipoprotein